MKGLHPLLLAFAAKLHFSSAASNAFRVAALQSNCGTLYTVVSGDGCFAIAENAKITLDQLQALNPDLNCDTLGVGDGVCLFLPCQTSYVVQSGDWCAKIQDEQHVSADLLSSLNPGLDCNTIFAGQRLCVAAPTAPPTSTSTPPPPGPTSPPLPTYDCAYEIPIAVGDTCFNLATEFNLQLSQFTSLNSHLNCDSLAPGEVACALHLADRDITGDWCAKIESDNSLASGDLIKLNPGLSCDALAADQVVCVAAPVEDVPPESEKVETEGDPFPLWSPGKDMPQSPLVDFNNAADARKTIVADFVFALDSQHKAAFAQADRNQDGHVDLQELQTIIAASAHFSRGLNSLDSRFTTDNVAEIVMKDCDKNGDGVLNEDEYINAAAEAQGGINKLVDQQVENLRRRELGLPEKRAFVLVGLLVSYIALLVGLSIDQALTRMEENARDDASDLLSYLDLKFWDRGNEPEPKCAAYMYYSSSCAALGTSWASHCSEGGKKVFPKSCNGLFTEGAKACGFLSFGCSSMCYKINTDGCDCDALNYTPQLKTGYCDTPLSSTVESGMGQCRTKCSSTAGCVGFTVQAENSSQVRCKIFRTMTCRETDSGVSAFRLVGGPVGGSTNPICPRPPNRSAPVPAVTIQRHQLIGAAMANLYSLKNAAFGKRAANATGTVEDEGDKVKRQSGSCPTTIPNARRRRRQVQEEDNNELELGARMPSKKSNPTLATRQILDDYDPRTTYRFNIKQQDGSMWCAPSTLTSVVEGSMMKQFGRTTPKQLSLEWVAVCRAAQSYLDGTSWDPLYTTVTNSFLATESCMPWNSGTSLFTCRNNQCGAGQYGSLPYIATPHTFWRVTVTNFLAQGTGLADDMKLHLKTKGPIFMGFTVTAAFNQYAATISTSPDPRPVFYDGHPSYAGHTCGSGHAMTVVGYFHYRRTSDPCGSLPRLVWIIQNSWGLASGKAGFVFVEYGSLAGGIRDESYGATVKEGSQWFSSQLPHNAG